MASTNKTTNYELSQYIGTDKPTYLGDYNSDMAKIDTAVHTVAQNVGTESARIGVIETDIGTMANLQTTDKSSVVNAVNEVNTKSETNKTNIGTLGNLETTNKTTVVNAINEIAEFLNVNNFTNIPVADISVVQGLATLDTSRTNMTLATNSDQSLIKLYGTIYLTNITANGRVRIKTSLRPTESMAINGSVLKWNYNRNNGDVNQVQVTGFSLDTSGNVETSFAYVGNSGESERISFIATLTFLKNFGDVPQQQ